KGAADGGPAQPAGAKEEGEENNPQADTHGAEVSREETTGPSGEHGGLGGSPSRENEPSPSGEAEGHSASGASTGVKAAEVQLGASLGGPSDAETSLGEGQTEDSLQGPPHAAPSTGLDGQRTVQEEQHKTDLSTPEEVPLKGADVSATQGDEHTQALKNTSDVNAQETTEIVPSKTPDGAAGSPQVEELTKSVRNDATGHGVAVSSAPTAGKTEEASTPPKPPAPTEGPVETGKETALGKAPSKENGVEESLVNDGNNGDDKKAKPKEALPVPAVTSNTPDGRAVDAPQPTAPSGGGGTSGEQAGKKAEAIAEDSAGPAAAAAPGAQQQGVAAAGTPTSNEKEPLPTARDTATEASHAATTTDGGSGSSPAAQPQPGSSVGTNEAGQREQEQPAATAPKRETEKSGERGEATQPAAGAAAQAANTTNNSTSAAKAAPGDIDGSSTAAAHSASPLALLLLLACAAAAAVLAA
ncbi:uncharacterized protein Tco025E_09955, partial [Trypanosoma conorhini]